MAGRWTAAVLGCLLGCGPYVAWAQAPPDASGVLRSLTVSDRDIQVTPRYSGELVRVRGTVGPGCDVVVKLSAAGRTVACSRMGKVGPFWLSLGRVRFGNVPPMYKVKTTRPLASILSLPEQLEYRLGFRGLRASLTVERGPQAELHLNELITVRELARLYAVADTGVAFDGEQFGTSFFWPAGAPAGRYEIQALAVRDQRVVDERSVSVVVREVGTEAFVSALARDHGVLYGLIAVALAGAIGVLMSLIFEMLWRRGPKPPRGRFIPTKAA
jgi:uncharacterized protein (TIGR02186 family)